MRTVKKVYTAFDDAYTTKEKAGKAIEGWEHSQEVKEAYASLEQDLADSLEKYGWIELDVPGIELFSTYEEAKEETDDCNYL